MSTHNIRFFLFVFFYGELEKIIPELALNTPPQHIIAPVYPQNIFSYFFMET